MSLRAEQTGHRGDALRNTGAALLLLLMHNSCMQPTGQCLERDGSPQLGTPRLLLKLVLRAACGALQTSLRSSF